MSRPHDQWASRCQDLRCDKPGDPSRTVWYCKACASCLCDVCWKLSPVHAAPGAAGHKKLAYHQYLVCDRLERILKPPTTQDELEKLHDQDTDTTWFGIDRWEDGRPFLQDFDTYTHLMANSPSADQVKYPQLVSFVGETSAGKSTLVKMLIDHEESKNDPRVVPTFPSPVVGSHINDSVPTSADVHLYCDPATWGKERPILYADCEGLNAGERVPMGAHSKRVQRLDHSRRLGFAVRPLEWANSDDTKTRQYAVTHIYPRLLYTFSDVVVFVLDKPKTFETSVLLKLFDWASDSLEASTNQGTLPHAVIALNFSHVDSDLWDPPRATKALLDANKHVLEPINGVPKLQKLADEWRRKNKHIHTIRDLIHCYYSSFTVVRLPNEKDLLLLSQQVSQLHTTIVERCELAYFEKKRARLLSSSEDVGFFIQQAFTHFSRNLHRPFDFKEYSLRRNPIPRSLGDHILRMAISLQKKFPQETGHWIFDKLSFMVASSFLYDCINYRKGQPQDLFGDYLPNFENALTEFCSLHWPCEFINMKARCVNVSKRHGKGHQNEKGKVIAAGDYVSKFKAEKYHNVWMNSLKTRLHDLQAELKKVEESGTELEDPLISIRKQHMMNIERFYNDVGGANNFTSHATCLCCLMRPPEHALRCGHVLCSSCVKSFGKVKKTTIEMRYCPLHPQETLSEWVRPWRIRMKPEFAGIRVLSLDGGGIRGIAELEVLQQIQCKLDVEIPIPAFFDLIVGTSTGGIIALALGVKQWSVIKCIEEFKRLCDKAFTPREFRGVWGLEYLTTAHHGSVWETTPLYQALEESLGTNSLFGGHQDSDTSYSARVAVTTSSEIATKGVVIANYCRTGEQRNYTFLRPNDPHMELMMWEAGAATAAAAPYFKPFVHRKTNEVYLDGAFYNNNPVKVGHIERKLLWTDVQEKPPDIFLSVGTSQDKKQVQKDLVAEEMPKRRRESEENDKAARIKASRKWRDFAGLVHLGKAAYNRLQDVINCEKQWVEFLEVTIDPKDRDRYMRINPDIGRPPPSLDDKEEVNKLQAEVARALTREHRAQLQIEDIVFRLVASSFYFDKGKATRSRSGGTATVSGKIQCRFEKSSEWLKQLGHYFKKQQRADFQPYFETWNGLQQQNKHEVELTQNVIERMASHGDFDIGETNITVSTTECNADIKLYFFASSHKTPGYSISGFPRDFLMEDDKTLRNSEEEDEHQGQNRARTRRRISNVQDQPRKETRSSSAHLRSASEQNLSTLPHGLQEGDRRRSDDTVRKSASLRMTVNEKRSFFSLRTRQQNERREEGTPVPTVPNNPQQTAEDMFHTAIESYNRAPSIRATPTARGHQLQDFASSPPRASTTPSAQSSSYMAPLPSLGFASSMNAMSSQNARELSASPVEREIVDSLPLRFSPNQSQGPWDSAPMYSDPYRPSYYAPSPYQAPSPNPSLSYTSSPFQPPPSNPTPSYASSSSNNTPRFSVPPQVHPQQSSSALKSPLGQNDQPVGNILRDSDDDADWELEAAKKASLVDYEKIKEEEEIRQALERSIIYK